MSFFDDLWKQASNVGKMAFDAHPVGMAYNALTNKKNQQQAQQAVRPVFNFVQKQVQPQVNNVQRFSQGFDQGIQQGFGQVANTLNRTATGVQDFSQGFDKGIGMGADKVNQTFVQPVVKTLTDQSYRDKIAQNLANVDPHPIDSLNTKGFFAPDPNKVRVRDVLREIPNVAAKGVYDIAQGSPEMRQQLVKDQIRGRDLKGDNLTPEQKQEVADIKARNEETMTNVIFGATGNMSKGQQGENAINTITKSKDLGEITQALRKTLGFTAKDAKQVAPDLVKPSTTQEVTDVIQNFTGSKDLASKFSGTRGLTQADTEQGFRTKPSNETVPEVFQPTGPRNVVAEPTVAPEVLALTKEKSGGSPLFEGAKTAAPMSQSEIDQMAGRALLNSENKIKFKDAVRVLIGSKNKGNIQAVEESMPHAKIGRKEAWDVIRGLEGKRKLVQGARESIKPLRQAFDDARQFGIDNGVDIGYLKNYVTHIWKESPEQITQKAKALNMKLKYSKGRVIVDYDTGIKMGLTPKYTHPAQLLHAYKKAINDVIANRKFYEEMKNQGLAVDKQVGKGRDGFTWVNVNGVKDGGFFTPSNLAEDINNIFNRPKPKGVGKVLHGGAWLSGKTQEIVLSGGVAGTPFNFFGIGVGLIKPMTSGRFRNPIKSFAISSVGDKLSNKWFQSGNRYTKTLGFDSHLDTLKHLYENGFDMRTSYNIDDVINKGFWRNVFGGVKGKGVIKNSGEVFHKAIDKPTFQRLLPIQTIMDFEQTASHLIKGGMKREEAFRVATEQTKIFHSISDVADDALKDPATQDAIKMFLFAPKYRANIINFWENNIKAISPIKLTRNEMGKLRGVAGNNPLSTVNKRNTAFMAGTVMSYLAYDQMNMKYNDGKHIYENPEGKKTTLMIPLGDGRVIGVPFQPSVGTLPRIALETAGQVSRGEILGSKGAITNATKVMASMPTKTAADIYSNQDYFGNPIYNESDSPTDQAINATGYAIKNLAIHPWAKGGIDTAADKYPDSMPIKLLGGKSGKSTTQKLSEASELPFRWYTQKGIDASEYYNTQDKYAKTDLKTDEQKKAFALLHSKKDNSSPLDSSLKALIYLEHPATLEVDVKTNQELAQKKKDGGDPFYTDWTPEQRKSYLQYTTMAPMGPDQKRWKKDNTWYNEKAKARSDFFATLPESDKKTEKVGPQYPEASPSAQEAQDKYFTLETGEQKALFLKNNPDLKAQWKAKDQYNNELRKYKGLQPMDTYPEASAQVTRLLDQYDKLPLHDGKKGGNASRAKFMTANPAIGNYFMQLSLYNLEQSAGQAAFQDTGFDQKGLKAIDSLGEYNVSYTTDANGNKIYALGNTGDSGGSGYGKYAKGGKKGKKIAKLKAPKAKMPKKLSVKKPKTKTLKLSTLKKGGKNVSKGSGTAGIKKGRSRTVKSMYS